MSITNLKTSVQIKMEIELEAWQKGEKQWNVSNQFNESILESALENFSSFDTLVEQWQKEGVSLQDVGVMDWAFALSEFQPSGLDNEWID